MKVLMINGSPEERCTHRALTEVARELEAEGVEVEIRGIGKKAVRGCLGCGKCADSRCVFEDDICNALIEAAESADGIVIGSPVYFAGINGALKALLDRMFYAGGSAFRGKPAAAVTSARRGGTTPTLDTIEKYFGITGMPVVSSSYWNIVHGQTVEQVEQDAEGLQVMRNLGRNMAWMLKCIDAGKAAGVEFPKQERGARTNFIDPEGSR